MILIKIYIDDITTLERVKIIRFTEIPAFLIFRVAIIQEPKIFPFFPEWTDSLKVLNTVSLQILCL